ncbi:hypothetical protein HPB52_003972 [Rhipicephalus sanguineus]|uniref:Uncharacterized protein n=1 Tax=Rhipicephalus sanguineus TaxID=34632 RepID=A0A9D4PLE9_RHISA|nr:hypothetical protein HPB52_003972 [Rhipicephalus sanguineus]
MRYDSLLSVNKTWPEWKVELKHAFPTTAGMQRLHQEMEDRIYKRGKPLTTGGYGSGRVTRVPFTEQPRITIVRRRDTVRIFEEEKNVDEGDDTLQSIEIPDLPRRPVCLWAKDSTVVLPNYVGFVELYVTGSKPNADVFADAQLRCQEGTPQQLPRAAPKQPRRQPEPAAPTPPRTTPEQRSVATWTHQDDQEMPRYFVSDLPWKAQRRVRREMLLDHVPWPFCGRTITEADVRSQGARLPDPPGLQACALCGVTVYFKSHYQGALHVAKTKAARDSRRHQAPTPTAPPLALPDQDLTTLCIERMVTSPNFAALVGTAPPAAAASAPYADDGVNDLLLDLSDENFI